MAIVELSSVEWTYVLRAFCLPLPGRYDATLPVGPYARRSYSIDYLYRLVG